MKMHVGSLSSRKATTVAARGSYKRMAALAMAIAPLTVLAQSSYAANLFWDSQLTPATPSGNTGTWDFNTTANWTSDLSTDIPWTDSSGGSDTATFGGTAGTVTVNTTGGSIGAAGLVFTTPSYVLTGNGLGIGANGIDTSALAAASTTTIGNSLTLVGGNAGNQTWNSGANVSNLVINGAISTNGFNIALVGSGNTTFNGAISGASVLIKTGSGTVTLAAANTYNGDIRFAAPGTLVTAGTLVTSVDHALPEAVGASPSITYVGTDVALGLKDSTAPVGLTIGGNQQIATLTGVSNKAAAVETISIASGKTLQVGTPSDTSGVGGRGRVIFGAAGNASNVTNVVFTGGGSFRVFADGDTGTFAGATNFNVGNPSLQGNLWYGGNGTGAVDASANTANVDMTGLTDFTANIGTLHIGTSDSGSPTPNAGSTLTLAGTSNTINCGRLDIASGGTAGSTTATDTLKLGAGTNNIGATNLYIGAGLGGAESNFRSSGAIVFNSASGTFTLRGGDANQNDNNLANSPAVVDMASNQLGLALASGNTITSTFDVSGHMSDIQISSLSMSTRYSNAGGATSVLSVGGPTGAAASSVMTATSILMSRHLTTNTGTETSTINLMGGTDNIGSLLMAQGNSSVTSGGSVATVNISAGTVTIGATTMSVNANSGTSGSTTATLNISGGTVGISSINMANAIVSGRTPSASINLTGGSLTMGGDIVRTGATNGENTTLTLNGGTLDMGGHNIGSGAVKIGTNGGSLNFQSGRLQNVGEINGGVGLTKTTSGTLAVAGVNTYTGATTVSAGTLQVVAPSAVPANNAVVVTTGEYQVSGAGNYALSSLTINGGEAHLLAGRNKTLTLPAAPTIGATAQLDLEDSAVIINYGADTTNAARDAIRNLLVNGRNAGPASPAPWNGLGGITSSYANANGNGFNLAIGYADNATLASINAAGSYTAFGGQTVASTTILVQMTRGADCNLDGVVDGSDVAIIGTHFNQPGSGQWYFGDFDYSGLCDGNDIAVLGTTFGSTSPTLSPAQMTAEFGSAFTAAFESGQAGAAVPEPASLTLLGLGAAAMLGKRKRRSL